ncbi:hypothetical protein TWF694_004216 [Orbilia ellipsospora]|uniref:TEA domain-containing protein n=1 Tax=Orbilia ellipsospora TaxID=2528407 RepID=A0AAV9X3E8_9PEZI
MSSQKLYHEYRQRQRRGEIDLGDAQAVWDDEAEEAFFCALELIPPMGRKRLTVFGKPSGRNELISKYIFMKTGKARTADQVSSHIQVLKRQLRDDPDSLKLLGSDQDTSELSIDEDTLNQLSQLADFPVDI